MTRRGEVPFGATARERAALNRMRRMSHVFDDLLPIPFTKWRFGVDPVLGLVPVVGDAVGYVTMAYLFVEAYLLGVPAAVYFRMTFNVTLDFAIGSIPVIGTIFDVYWQANNRNVDLLESHVYDRIDGRRKTFDRRRRLPAAEED